MNLKQIRYLYAIGVFKGKFDDSKFKSGKTASTSAKSKKQSKTSNEKSTKLSDASFTASKEIKAAVSGEKLAPNQMSSKVKVKVGSEVYDVVRGPNPTIETTFLRKKGSDELIGMMSKFSEAKETGHLIHVGDGASTQSASLKSKKFPKSEGKGQDKTSTSDFDFKGSKSVLESKNQSVEYLKSQLGDLRRSKTSTEFERMVMSSGNQLFEMSEHGRPESLTHQEQGGPDLFKRLAKDMKLVEYDSIEAADNAKRKLLGKPSTESYSQPSQFKAKEVSDLDQKEFFKGHLSYGDLASESKIPTATQKKLSDAFTHYVGEGYQELNNQKRFGHKFRTPEGREAAKAIDQAFSKYAKPLQEPLKVGRLVSEPFASNFRRQLSEGTLVGTTLEDKGYLSTTYDLSGKSKPGHLSSKTTMVISAGKGQKIIVLGSGEREVLFPPGRKMKVTSAGYKGDNLVVHLDMLDD